MTTEAAGQESGTSLQTLFFLHPFSSSHCPKDTPPFSPVVGGLPSPAVFLKRKCPPFNAHFLFPLAGHSPSSTVDISSSPMAPEPGLCVVRASVARGDLQARREGHPAAGWGLPVAREGNPGARKGVPVARGDRPFRRELVTVAREGVPVVRGDVQVTWEGVPVDGVCVPVARGDARVRWEGAPVAKEGITVAGGNVEVRLEGTAVSRDVLPVGFNGGDARVLLEETGGVVSVQGAAPLDRAHRERTSTLQCW